METEKETKSEWFIAGIFFVVSGAIVPLLMSEILSLILFSEFYQSLDIGYTFTISFLTTFMAIAYSAKLVATYVDKKFEKRDPKKVAQISAGYFITIMVTWLMIEWLGLLNLLGIRGEFGLIVIGLRIFVLGSFTYILYKSVYSYYKKQPTKDTSNEEI